MVVVFGLASLANEIILQIPDDYCQGDFDGYVLQAPAEVKVKQKLKSVKVTRGKN